MTFFTALICTKDLTYIDSACPLYIVHIYKASLLWLPTPLPFSPFSSGFLLPHWHHVVLLPLPAKISRFLFFLRESCLFADWTDDGAEASDDLWLDELVVGGLWVPRFTNGLSHAALKLVHAREWEWQVTHLQNREFNEYGYLLFPVKPDIHYIYKRYE